MRPWKPGEISHDAAWGCRSGKRCRLAVVSSERCISYSPYRKALHIDAVRLSHTTVLPIAVLICTQTLNTPTRTSFGRGSFIDNASPIPQCPPFLSSDNPLAGSGGFPAAKTDAAEGTSEDERGG